ncbi:MAG: glycosyltransferase family 2 protein [Flavobacteriaceae bacterium]|jgi:glycosyltransferase involved in cell wall biosynthesis|nr:glycosyltransferase family 2 protein [Flavobacteriaceae bacterium]
MTISLIVSTYNWSEALFLCLKSVEKQSVLPDEIIIADDGSDFETKKIIDSFRDKIKVPIKHVWHKDDGFRLAEIRNKAVLEAKGDYIVQIDGDVILHRHFIKDHKLFAKENTFIKGRRAMIGAKTSEKLLKNGKTNISFLSSNLARREHGIRIPNFQKIFTTREENSADGVMGSNMAFWRKDFVEVNGYNNALKGWGAEDKELAQRMVNNGIKKRKIKFGAIQYHLYHEESDKKNHDKQVETIENLQKSGKIRCENGLSETEKNYIVYE